MNRPLSITLIGTTLIFLGLYVGLGMIMDAIQRHRYFLNLAVLMIPIGIGLLRGRPNSAFWARASIAFVGLCSAGIVLRFLAGTHHAPAPGTSAQFLAALFLLIFSPFAWRSLRDSKVAGALRTPE